MGTERSGKQAGARRVKTPEMREMLREMRDFFETTGYMGSPLSKKAVLAATNAWARKIDEEDE